MAKKEIILVQEPEGIPWALCAVYTPNPWKKGSELLKCGGKEQFLTINQSKIILMYILLSV